MSETPRKLEEDDSPEPQAGERLAAARRARDISLRDIAKELHLDEPKVQALEDNRFEVLGAPVFAKGHLRKYAELVGVSVEDVLADYYRLNRSAGAPPLVGLRRHPSGERHVARWLFVALLIIVAAGAAFWWFTLKPPADPPRTPVTEPAPRVVEPEAAVRLDDPVAEESTDVVENLPAAPDRPVPDTPGPEGDGGPAADAGPAPDVFETPAAVDVQPERPPTAEGQVELRLSYSGDCWTEVTDATGRRLYFDLGREGRVVTVSGVAPLQVLLGVSDNVSVAVDGVDYVIRNSELRGNNTALLTIRGR